MGTIQELAEKKIFKVRRPCWTDKAAYIETWLTNGKLPEWGYLCMGKVCDRIPLSPFLEFNDFHQFKG